ncbi:hypothetical protein L208DRAFT_1235133, partial [Tricholoma matsutake]
VSALTFVSYDIIISSGQEIKYVWTSKWSIVKTLYFIVRYYAVINLMRMFAYAVESTLLTLQIFRCRHYYLWTVIAGPSICILILDTILALRLWALYNRRKLLLVVLGILILCESAALCAINVQAQRLAKYVVPMPAPWRGCASVAPYTAFVLLAYVPNLVLSVLFLGMTLWKLFVENRELHDRLIWKNLRDMEAMEPLLLAFVRDGTIFFALCNHVSVAAVFGLLCRLTVAGVVSAAYYPWILVIFSYSGSHLVLNLQAAGERNSSQTWQETWSTQYNQDDEASQGIIFA